MAKIALKTAQILLTGGTGFLGQHVERALLSQGVKPAQIIIPKHGDFDLRSAAVCADLTKEIDIVIHLAGNVGGIGYNQKFPGTLFYDNLMMGVNLIEAARLNKVKKFVCIGTVCAYPKFAPVPFHEDELWNGYPEETNAPYGIAKKALLVMLQSYRQQYGMNGIYLLPVNMYGPGDNFDPRSSHVMPALIRKIAEAKQNHRSSITVWGDGSATREFLYVEDAAKAIVLAAAKYNRPEPINIGTNAEISIKELVIVIADLMGYEGKIVWDKTKPNGQPRRKLDVTKMAQELKYVAKTKFKTGLQKTINWYLKHSDAQ